MTTPRKWFVWRTTEESVRASAHRTRSPITKCGTIILSNLLSRQILQIFVFGVYMNVCISYTHIHVCVWMEDWGAFCTITIASSHICHKNTHTLKYRHCMLHSNNLMLCMCVFSVLRFVSIRILCALWNVYIEIMCYLVLAFPKRRWKILLSHTEQMK